MTIHLATLIQALPRALPLAACAALPLLASAQTALAPAPLDPKAVTYQLEPNLKWVPNAAGTNEQAVLFGDPSKPGPYVIRIKWKAGHFSRPHFHSQDRFFVVLSGTWWMGTGTDFDPARTTPMPAGSHIVHHAGQVHYDGARNEDAIIQVWGIGPVQTTQASAPAR